MGRYDGPDFETDASRIVSVWAATVPFDDIPDDYWMPDWNGGDDDPWNQFATDFGFGYDDNVESYCDDPDHRAVPIRDLIAPLSYAKTFIDAVVLRAREQGVADTTYVYLIYDLQYDSQVTKKERSP